MAYVYQVYTQREANGPFELVGAVPERRGPDRVKDFDEKGGLNLAVQFFGPIVKRPTKIFIEPKEVI